jgi:hypothetical protein
MIFFPQFFIRSRIVSSVSVWILFGFSGRSVSLILSDGFANCVDGSMVALSLASGHNLFGTTWQGNPHVIAEGIPGVGSYDSANMMITGKQ